jgi:hypothetical protein|uniref:Uncharacterized protein n=1 Tax=Populus trichocarpa TaxID=3694 RepID=A0A2K2C126_POPTR
MRQHIFKLRISDVYLLITLQKVASYGSFSWSYHKIPRSIVTGIKLPRENHDLDRFMVNLCLVSTKLAIWISFFFF